MKPKITTARFIIIKGAWLPLAHSLYAGEQLKKALMSIAEDMFGSHSIPWEISGHNLPEGSNHEHLFYIPDSYKNKNSINAFFIYCKKGFDQKTIQALKKLRYITNPKGKRWDLALENFGTQEDFKNQYSLMGSSSIWESSTPYFHPWHKKKNFGIIEQIKKECNKRGLSNLKNIQLIPYISKKDKRIYPFYFKKFRSKKGLIQPDRQGGFWRLTFSSPIQGPVSLGFGCHFGLGIFRAVNKIEKSWQDVKTA